MPTQVQFRRGTTAQNNSFTGADGELTVDTTLKTLRVHDGTTVGGFVVGTLEVQPDTSNEVRYLSFTDQTSGLENKILIDSDLTYNPSTNVLSAGTGSFTTLFANGNVSFSNTNTVTGTNVLALGTNGNANANNSQTHGDRATVNSLLGLMAFGFNGGGQNVTGRTQMSWWHGYANTTGTTGVRATANSEAASSTNQLALRDNSVFLLSGYVVVRDSVTNDMKMWKFEGGSKRGTGVGTVTITDMAKHILAQDTAAATWDFTLSADTTNGSVAVTCTGSGTNQLRWTVVVHSVEIN